MALKSMTSTMALAFAGMAATATVASAQTYQGRSAYAQPYQYAPGEIIARRTAQAQRDPGVTNELAPDSSQTATGGPVGGVPGFDGQ